MYFLYYIKYYIILNYMQNNLVKNNENNNNNCKKLLDIFIKCTITEDSSTKIHCYMLDELIKKNRTTYLTIYIKCLKN